MEDRPAALLVQKPLSFGDEDTSTSEIDSKTSVRVIHCHCSHPINRLTVKD